MAMNSKGYVLTPVKDVMHVLTIVERVIHDLIRQKVTPPTKNSGHRLPEGYSYPMTSVSPAMATAETRFTLNGEARTLSVYFACDGDPVGEYAGKKLVLMMGFGGLADTVIPAVLAKLAHLGPCLFDRGSLESTPEPVDCTAMTFAEAVRGRYDRAENVHQWMEYHRTVVTDKVMREYLGLSHDQLTRFLAAPESIGEICKAQPAVTGVAVTR